MATNANDVACLILETDIRSSHHRHHMIILGNRKSWSEK